MHKGDGFTIIEVMLFLGITAMLLTMILFGTGVMARQNRFADTVNTFQAFVQKQYEDVLSGVNPRQPGQGCLASSQAGADSCLLIGKVISFTTGGPFQGTVRYIRTPVGNVPDTGDVYTQISLTNPEVVAISEQPFELQWGASVQSASRSTAPLSPEPSKSGSSPARASINAVAFMRSPNSSQIVPYYFYASSNDLVAIDAGLKKAVQAANAPLTSQTNAVICIHNQADWAFNAPVAGLEIGNGRGTAGIDANFQPTTGAGGVCN